MCGIGFFLMCKHHENTKIEHIISSLKCRGPDCSKSLAYELNDLTTVTFFGSLLWLQGKEAQQQPIVDEDGNVLLWNGDILGQEIPSSESDTAFLMKELRGKDELKIGQLLSRVRGPWSIIYYQSTTKRLFVSRDLFGRHSLLWSSTTKEFIISSVAYRDSGFEEVPAFGLFIIELDKYSNNDPPLIKLMPWNTIDRDELRNITSNFIISENCLRSPIKIDLNKDLPSDDTDNSLQKLASNLSQDDVFSAISLDVEVTQFIDHFKESIRRRVRACPPICKSCFNVDNQCSHSRFAVLFSGGLDSAVIALLLSLCLPKNEPIDLLNVAFEMKPQMPLKKGKKPNHIPGPPSNPCFTTPDRKSGMSCLKQLEELQPKRTWNFVEVNVTCKELQNERSKVISDLIAPHATVLDDSIGCALYFCGRGIGVLNGLSYESPARVLFSGMGADEQLAGYSRHRARFLKDGWMGLVEEIHMEMTRISSRNLGRDNRVLCHHGRAPRFPYLDEDVVSFLNSLPIWKKANLYLPRGVGEKILLRAAAASLGLTCAASLPKRAIQFGSRIAKLENSKEKGSDGCSRLENG